MRHQKSQTRKNTPGEALTKGERTDGDGWNVFGVVVSPPALSEGKAVVENGGAQEARTNEKESR